MERWKENPSDPRGNVEYGNLMKEEFVSFSGDRSGAVFIDRIGVTHPDPDYSVYRKRNNMLVIEYVISGRGFLDIDGCVREVKANDAYIIPPDVECRYWADRRDPFKKIWVNVFSDMLVAVFHKLRPDKLYVYESCTPQVELILWEMLRYAESNKNSPDIHLELSSSVYLILTKLALNHSPELRGGIAQKACSRINSSLYSNVKIKDIADELFISENHLICEFKRVYGKTPRQYLIEKRLEIIKDMLENTDTAIFDISRQFNFADEHYFSTFFKNRVGKTPTEYRNCAKARR